LYHYVFHGTKKLVLKINKLDRSRRKNYPETVKDEFKSDYETVWAFRGRVLKIIKKIV